MIRLPSQFIHHDMETEERQKLVTRTEVTPPPVVATIPLKDGSFYQQVFIFTYL